MGSFDSDNMNAAISCYIVLVGGKYLNDIKDVMTKVDSVKVVVGVRPQAIFIQSNNYSENLDIDMKTITTVMVQLQRKRKENGIQVKVYCPGLDSKYPQKHFISKKDI